MRATFWLLALAALLPRSSDAAEVERPVWVDASFGGGTTLEGQGLAGGGSLAIGRPSGSDFLRLRWNNFGEDRESGRRPHADWMQTVSLLYGVAHRESYLWMTAAAGVSDSFGFARGEFLYEDATGFRWYRPRHFNALGIGAEAFAGGATRNFAAGIRVSADANPIRQSATVQFTLSLGALP